MIKCLLLLPTSYNDGAPIDPATIRACLESLDQTIGGHTVDGTCEGVYRMSDGSYAKDVCTKVWAVVEPDALPALRSLVKRFAVDLGQETIYFERTQTDVEFIGHE